jgi:soluble lytic murein transglycosylase
MPAKIRSVLLLAAAALVLLGHEGYGQALYAYTDENGIRVFTNIAPEDAVRDLVVTGSPPSVSSLDDIIEKYARHYRLDPSLIRSIIETESGFNPEAVSPKGARGLMQLMPETAERLGVENSFDPEQNIHGGVRHFRSLLDTFNNDLALSLAAYNAGENLVQRLGRVPKIKETQDYIQSITKLYGKNDLNAHNPQSVKYPQTFSFYDDSGVLNLTNIPTVQ